MIDHETHIVSVTGGFLWRMEDEMTEGFPGPASKAAQVNIAST